MTIPRTSQTNPTKTLNAVNWQTNESLTIPQLNSIDGYLQSALDNGKNGINPSDNLQSVVTVNSAGKLQFNSDSNLTINNPAKIFVGSGNLNTGAEIHFDGGLSLTTINFTTNFIHYTLSNYEYSNFTIKLTGIIYPDVNNSFTITIPNIVGYTKLIDNQTTSEYNNHIIILTSIGASNVYIYPGEKCLIYNGGPNDVRKISDTGIYSIILTNASFQKILSNQNSSNYVSTNSTNKSILLNDQNLPISCFFPNVKINDLLDISYNLFLISYRSQDGYSISTTQDGYSLISIGQGPYKLVNGIRTYSSYIDLPETTCSNLPKYSEKTSCHGQTIFSQTNFPGPYEIFIRYYSVGVTSFSIQTPISLTAKQLRRI